MTRAKCKVCDGKAIVRVVPADSFVETLAANVDNDKLDDAAFRQFVRNTLPIVIVQRKKKEE